jgi:hypothetical protein
LCSLLMSASNPSMLTGSTSPAARTIRLRNSKLIALAHSNSSRNSTASALFEARKVRHRFSLLAWSKDPCPRIRATWSLNSPGVTVPSSPTLSMSCEITVASFVPSYVPPPSPLSNPASRLFNRLFNWRKMHVSSYVNSS